MLSIGVHKQKISFGRALTTQEMQQFTDVSNNAKQKLGNVGKSILIVPDTCLPQAESNNTGVGNISAEESQHFFDFMKKYLNINMVEVLPPGEIVPSTKKFYSSYTSTALSLGSQQVNLKLLTQPEYGNILTLEEFNNVVKSNTRVNKENIVNFENVTGFYSEHNKALRKAFERFKFSNNLKSLKDDFENYKSENADWLEPKGLFSSLVKENKSTNWHSWNDNDKNLMHSHSNESAQRIAELKSKYADDIDFFKFKQFIADKHLKTGRELLNNKGIKLTGDCLIGFSQDEVWANQSAFEKGAYVGLTQWGLPALNYDTIKDENSASAKLLKRKVELFARRYDTIRFDVAWAYVAPRITPEGHKTYGAPKYQGNAVLEMIERTVKSVKGEKFNIKDLLYEFDAGVEEFSMFEGNMLIEPLRNRTKVLGSTYMGYDWGSNDAFLKRGFGEDNFVMGVGNHDPQPLRQIAYNMPDEVLSGNGQIIKNYHKEGQIEPLARILKLDPENIRNPIEFMKAKFAESLMAKHHQFFYMDVFGREERFDSQGLNGELNYRYKINENFEKEYHTAVQEGH